MKFTINHTGSGGNSYFLEFADGKKIMIEAGKTAHYNAYLDFIVKKQRVSDFVGYLVSHDHSDHAGALADFQAVGMKEVPSRGKDICVLKVKLSHNAECDGFVVVNHTTNEALVFMIDFNGIIEKRKLFEAICAMQKLGKAKIAFAVELSYCEFLYKKLPINQRFGLQNHNSDENFVDMFKFFKKKGIDISNIVTLHASGREINDKGFHADVCPKDYLTNYLRTRLGVFVNIGRNGMTYEF